MNRFILTSTLTATLLLLSFTDRQACAQFGGSSARSVGRATQNYLYNRPTVSPYLNLTSRSASSGMPAYFTMVRPQVEQNQRAQAADRQTAAMQSQLNQVQDQVRESQQQASGMMLTGRMGWSSRGYPRFGSYMSYYPGFQRIPR